VPCNEVNFTVKFDVKQEGGHYFKVKYDWFDAKAPTADAPQVIDKVEQDSGFLKDWNLVQIEGEEPVEAPAEGDPKAKAGKAPPPKGGAKGGSALEEINDNRPRFINFEKKFGAEGEGGAPVKITEAVAQYFENFMMAISIWKTDRETQEETYCE
jgi:hypothetical protein